MLNLIRSLTRKQKVWVFLAIDLALIPAALLFTYSVQALPTTALETLFETLPILPYLLATAAALAMWLGIPGIQLKAFEGHAVRLTAILAAGLTVAAAILSGLAGLKQPPGTHVIFGLSYFMMLVTSRAMLYQVVTTIYRRAQPRCRVLIYGAGTTGTQLASALRSHEGIDPVAFVDDNTSLQGMTLIGLPVFAPAGIAELVVQRQIHRVLLAMPSLSQPKQAQIARRLQKMGLEVQALPSFAQLIGEEALIDKLTPVAPQSFLGRAARNEGLSGNACESYAGRVVLVSGAGGSIGSELCRQVLACAAVRRVVLYEMSELALYTVHQELMPADRGYRASSWCRCWVRSLDARQVRRVLEESPGAGGAACGGL